MMRNQLITLSSKLELLKETNPDRAYQLIEEAHRLWTTRIDGILGTYQSSFCGKVYSEENNDHDLLMDVFGITPGLKRENRQYWGRELGKCWELFVIEICKHLDGYKPALRIGADELCDLVVGRLAIDTKYRIGSGDSGTLKKFKSYGKLLIENGYQPVFLILREDNLPAAITACNVGGWKILCGSSSFDFIKDISGVDAEEYLKARNSTFPVQQYKKEHTEITYRYFDNE